METRHLLLPLLMLVPLGTLAGCSEAPAPTDEEVAEDAMAGLPNGIALDDRTVGAGQPSEETLRGLGERGYGMVISLRQPDERGAVAGTVVEDAGMQWAALPIGGADFTAEDARALRAALDSAPADKRILVHCGSGSRVGALWATMHALEEGLTAEQAVELAQASGKVRENSLERVREVVAAEQGE